MVDSHILSKKRLAAIRWGTQPVVPAPALDPSDDAVRRWLPTPESSPQARSPQDVIDRALDTGELAELALALASTDQPQAWVRALDDSLDDRVPPELVGLLSSWIGEVADHQGWKLTAYEALVRAAPWVLSSQGAELQGRLAELVLELGDLPEALEHSERALSLLDESGGAPAPADRLRWLAELYRRAGRREDTVRCATQRIELEPSRKAYLELAEELERDGDTPRAKACRALAERWKDPPGFRTGTTR